MGGGCEEWNVRKIPQVGTKVVFKEYPDMPFTVFSVTLGDILPVTLIHPISSALMAVRLKEIDEYKA